MRSALCELRRKMDAADTPLHLSVIVGGRDDLQMNGAQVTSDVGLYREKLRQAKRTRCEEARCRLFEQAVELYRGDLLSDLDDDWILSERRDLIEEQRAALAQLTAWHDKAGNSEKAILYAQQAARLDWRDETACCCLMRLYMRCGRYAEVQAQYARLRRGLRQDWEEEKKEEERKEKEKKREGDAGGVGDCAPLPSEEAGELNRQAGECLRASAHALKSQTAAPASRAAASAPRATPKQDASRTPRHAPQPQTSSAPLLRPCPPPPHLTRYFDQHGQAAALADALRQGSPPRLVTLVGFGGAGKTRLAAETARRLQAASDAFPKGFQNRVFWIDLTPLRNAAQIADAIADAVLPCRDGELPALDQLARDMGGERALVVLDNFEQLAEQGAGVVRDLLHRLPLLSVLVTSRQRLRVQGEQIHPLALLTPPGQRGFICRPGAFGAARVYLA